MFIKYIIGLLALQPDPYIYEAQRVFADVQDHYIVGPTSYPHITLCQFYADEAIMQKIENDLKTLQNVPQPHFTGLHFVKDPLPKLWGVEISARRDAALMNYHNNVIIILQSHGVKTYVNDTHDLFRPHLTLARINKLQLYNFNDNLLQDTPFILATGQAGPLGQFEIIRMVYK